MGVREVLNMAKDLIDTETTQHHDSKTLVNDELKDKKQTFQRAVKRNYQRHDHHQKTR